MKRSELFLAKRTEAPHNRVSVDRTSEELHDFGRRPDLSSERSSSTVDGDSNLIKVLFVESQCNVWV